MQYLIEQFNIGNFGRVINEANRLLKTAPSSDAYEILKFKSQAFINLNKHEDGINCLKELSIFHPKKVEPKVMLSLALIDIGNYEEATQQLKQCLKIEPENLIVINNLIFIAEELRDYNEVKHLNEIFLKIDSNDPSYWNSLGMANMELGNYNEAIKQLKIALEKSKNDDYFMGSTFNNLGYVLTRKGESTKSITMFEQAYNYLGEDPFLLNNWGYALATTGNIGKGLELINKSIRLDNSNSYVFKNKAKISLIIGDKKEAIKNLKIAQSLDYELDYGSEVKDLLSELTK